MDTSADFVVKSEVEDLMLRSKERSSHQYSQDRIKPKSNAENKKIILKRRKRLIELKVDPNKLSQWSRMSWEDLMKDNKISKILIEKIQNKIKNKVLSSSERNFLESLIKINSELKKKIDLKEVDRSRMQRIDERAALRCQELLDFGFSLGEAKNMRYLTWQTILEDNIYRNRLLEIVEKRYNTRHAEKDIGNSALINKQDTHQTKGRIRQSRYTELLDLGYEKKTAKSWAIYSWEEILKDDSKASDILDKLELIIIALIKDINKNSSEKTISEQKADIEFIANKISKRLEFIFKYYIKADPSKARSVPTFSGYATRSKYCNSHHTQTTKSEQNKTDNKKKEDNTSSTVSVPQSDIQEMIPATAMQTEQQITQTNINNTVTQNTTVNKPITRCIISPTESIIEPPPAIYLNIAAQLEQFAKSDDYSFEKHYDPRKLQIGVLNIKKPMNTHQINLVGNALLKAFNTVKKKKKLISGFIRRETGWILLTCLNFPTFEWVKKAIPKLKPWPEAILTVLIGGSISPPTQANTIIPTHEVKNLAQALRLIKIQNLSVYPFHWKISYQEKDDRGFFLKLYLDEASAKVIRASNNRLTFCTSFIQFRMKNKEDVYPKIPDSVYKNRHLKPPSQNIKKTQEDFTLDPQLEEFFGGRSLPGNDQMNVYSVPKALVNQKRQIGSFTSSSTRVQAGSVTNSAPGNRQILSTSHLNSQVPLSYNLPSEINERPQNNSDNINLQGPHFMGCKIAAPNSSNIPLGGNSSTFSRDTNQYGQPLSSANSWMQPITSRHSKPTIPSTSSIPRDKYLTKEPHIPQGFRPTSQQQFNVESRRLECNIATDTESFHHQSNYIRNVPQDSKSTFSQGPSQIIRQAGQPEEYGMQSNPAYEFASLESRNYQHNLPLQSRGVGSFDNNFVQSNPDGSRAQSQTLNNLQEPRNPMSSLPSSFKNINQSSYPSLSKRKFTDQSNTDNEPKRQKINTDLDKNSCFALFVMTPESYPGENLDSSHIKVLQKLITDLFMTTPDPLPKIIVNDKIENGTVKIRCENFESAVWVMENLNNVVLGSLKVKLRKIEGAEPTAIDIKEADNKTIKMIWKTSNVDISDKNAIFLLKRLNPELLIDKWKIVHRIQDATEKNSVERIVLMDESSAEFIKANSYCLPGPGDLYYFKLVGQPS